MPSPKKPKAEMLEALARYEAAHAPHESDPKVTSLTKKVKPRRAGPAPSKRSGKPLTRQEYRDKMVELFRLQHLKKAEGLPTYDVTSPTRYEEVPMWKEAGDERLFAVVKRYAYAMRSHSISPEQFKFWRINIMYMSPGQLAQLVRVSERTVRNWENGTSEIPFSMWWVMHSTLQDPEIFLTRPGFHDYYIEYDRASGEPALCSYTWPDIRFTPTDLYLARTLMSKVNSLEFQAEAKQAEVDALTAENTRLRQMLKAGTVAQELAEMHAHIGNLLARMHTADIVEFPQPAEKAAAA